MGKLVDISGNGNIIDTIIDAVSTSKGMTFKKATSPDGGYAQGSLVASTDYPFAIKGRFRADGTQYIGSIVDASAASTYFAVSVNGGLLRMESRNAGSGFEVNSSIGSFYDDDKEHDFVAVWVSSTNRLLYIDGVLDNSWTTGSVLFPTGLLDAVGLGQNADTSPQRTGLKELIDFEIINYIPTLQQAVDYHNSFARQIHTRDPLAIDQGVGDNI